MYLSAAEARHRLRVSRDTISKLIKAGDLKASKIGHSRNSPYRISEDDLADFMDRQAIVAVGGAPPAAPRTGLLAKLGRDRRAERP